MQRQLEDAARKLRCYERQDMQPTGWWQWRQLVVVS
jgi:hypothetical protein